MASWLNARCLRRALGVVVGVGTILIVAHAARAQVAYELLHAFAFDQAGCPGGCSPLAGLVEATDGSFFGTTEDGGAAGGGTVFKITAAGIFIILHSFSFECCDGHGPVAGLIQATDGDFYGTTPSGGRAGAGTVFRITASGALTTLHSFADSPNEGARPEAGLIQASDGDFYGTTQGGGLAGAGTVYKITAAGALTTLHSFGITGTDGTRPVAGLIQARDGAFYGTAESDGAGFCGTVFKITPSGTLTTLHAFGQSTDGCRPEPVSSRRLMTTSTARRSSVRAGAPPEPSSRSPLPAP